jgi:flavin-dependent dehydrogenase
VYGHWSGVPTDGYRWIYARDASVGVIPTNGEAACVFVTVPAHRFAPTFRGNLAAGFHGVVERLDAGLAVALQGRVPSGGLQGFGGLAGSFTRSHGPGWALVGDAAYFKDPLTAHGITDAFLHAELLAEAIAVGSDQALATYHETRTVLATPVFDATEAIAAFDWTFDELRGHHKRLARAMASEIDAALAAFGEAAGDLRRPALDDHQVSRSPGLTRLGEQEQELTAVR